MCENCNPNSKEMEAAYEEFEAAIKKLLEFGEHAHGILTDWVLITAQSVMHDNGTSSHAVGWEAGLNQAYFKSKGLVHEVADTMRANDTVYMINRNMSD